MLNKQFPSRIRFETFPSVAFWFGSVDGRNSPRVDRMGCSTPPILWSSTLSHSLINFAVSFCGCCVCGYRTQFHMVDNAEVGDCKCGCETLLHVVSVSINTTPNRCRPLVTDSQPKTLYWFLQVRDLSLVSQILFLTKCSSADSNLLDCSLNSSHHLTKPRSTETIFST